MKPGDMVRVTNTNSFYFFYEVVGVFLGAEKQDGVIELKAVNQKENTQGRILVPSCFFDVFPKTGSILVYSK